MIQNGYFKFYRKFADSEDFQKNLEMSGLFIHLLCKARWTPSIIKLNGKPVRFEGGTLVLSLRNVAIQHEISKDKVRRYLQYFEQRGSIKIHNKGNFARQEGLVISFVNWRSYQFEENDVATGVRQECDRSETGLRQECDSYKKVRREEGKKGKREDAPPPAAPLRDEPNPVLGEEKRAGGVNNNNTQLLLDTQLSGTANTVEPQPLTPTPIDPDAELKKKRNVEIAIWRKGLYDFSKAVYLELGLDATVYPRLDERLSGRLRQLIEKLGEGDLRAGTQKLTHAILANGEEYREKRSSYFFPTIVSIIEPNKLAKLLEISKNEYEFPEIDNTHENWRAFTSGYLGEVESKSSRDAVSADDFETR